MESVGQRDIQADWKTITNFSAKTTFLDKVFRTANIAIFATALYSVGAELSSPVSYCAYALVARKAFEVFLGFLSYPAGLMPFYYITPNRLNGLTDKGFTVREILLEKSGTIYPAYVITHPDTENNGKWMLKAFGAGVVAHGKGHSTVEENYKKYKSNTMILMGYSPGLTSWPTRYQLGGGFEAALQFLEDEVKAKEIVMRGASLGGGMLSEAVLQHDFKKEGVEYLFVAKNTFSRLSTVAGKMLFFLVKPLFLLSGHELDCGEGAKKLSQHNIKQIVVQHTSPNPMDTDGLIPDNATLAHWLKSNPLEKKNLLLSESIRHDGFLPSEIQNSLDHEVNQFFGNSSTG